VNKREWVHLCLGLGAIALTVTISLLLPRGKAVVSQLDFYLDHHAVVPPTCGPGKEAVVLYQSGFGPEDGYDRGWQVAGLNPTWALVSYGYDGPGWRAYGYGISDQRLVSPPIELPLNATQIRLRFYNRQYIESAKHNCYDGALLETSVDGGTLWAQVHDAQLLTDPYDGTILNFSSNPLAGYPAWCNSYYAWLDSVVDLDEHAGETVRLRFRLGTDSSNYSSWYVDEVRVDACLDPRALPLYLPVVFR
jgi:hypothetical protein